MTVRDNVTASAFCRVTTIREVQYQADKILVIEHGSVHVPEGRRLFPQMSVGENLTAGKRKSQRGLPGTLRQIAPPGRTSKSEGRPTSAGLRFFVAGLGRSPL
jgi:hypothetical protein